MDKHSIEQSARDQAMKISEALVQSGAYLPDQTKLQDEELMRHLAETQVVALIAYMQKLGVYETVETKRKKQALDPDSHRK
jgi:hypothetical protein